MVVLDQIYISEKEDLNNNQLIDYLDNLLKNNKSNNKSKNMFYFLKNNYLNGKYLINNRLQYNLLNNIFLNKHIRPIITNIKKKYYTPNIKKEVFKGLDLENQNELRINLYDELILKNKLIENMDYLSFLKANNQNDKFIEYDTEENILKFGDKIVDLTESPKIIYTKINNKNDEEIVNNINDSLLNSINIDNPYINNTLNNSNIHSYKLKNLKYSTECLRLENYDDFNNNKNPVFKNITVLGQKNTFIDNYSNNKIRDINGYLIDNLKTCNGQGKYNEYSLSINDREHYESDFNKSINQPSSVLKLLEGDSIDIIGFFVNFKKCAFSTKIV